MTALQTRYAHGTPCWVSLMAEDIEVAKAFFGQLFGWEYTPGPGSLGTYVRATLGGAKVAGIGARPTGRGFQVEWTTYFAADDADEVAQRIRECGGTVAVGPLQADSSGRLAIAADLAGATFGIWQGEDHLGAELVGPPGTAVWNELLTNDEPRAAQFYGTALGRPVVSADPSAVAQGEEDATLLVAGHAVAGLRQSADLRDGPPRWRVYFAVADVDESVALAVRLGGRVLVPAEHTPYGRVARLADPEGGRFSIVQVLPD